MLSVSDGQVDESVEIVRLEGNGTASRPRFTASIQQTPLVALINCPVS